MIAELLEAFGNRLHPRIVVSFQLWLFLSCFGTTYLSPSVNPHVFVPKGVQRTPRNFFECISILLLASLGLNQLPSCSNEIKSFGHFFTYQCIS